MQAAPYPRLLADIGGTGQRFAWIEAAGSEMAHLASYEDAAEIGPAIANYLGRHDLGAPASCAIGVAAPVLGDVVTVTNRSGWQFSISRLRSDLGLRVLRVMNDFDALARALPALRPDEVREVGGSRPAAPGGTRALIGPGTGLGIAGLVQGADGPVPVVGEGGHASIAASDAREDAVLARLRRRFGHVSAERVLSGPGIANLHGALRELAGKAAEPLAPARIAELAQSGEDEHCADAMALFFALLGSFAGDLALTLGARGGVYLGGGIVAKSGSAIERSTFRARFEAKGRYRDYLSAIPTLVLGDASRLALRGANAALGGDSSPAGAAGPR